MLRVMGMHREAARLSARLFEVHTQPMDAIAQARSLVSAGDIAGALAVLATALASGAIDVEQLRMDGALAPLLHDARFDQLVSPAAK